MLWIYRLLFIPILLLATPYYLLRMKRRGGYRRHFAQRFGSVRGLPEKRPGVRRIWLQAVSVGELFAIGPILDALKTDRRIEIYLTTTTSTGFKVAKERYHDQTIGIGYFPIDWWWFVWRSWHRIDPDLMLLTEGERWPEHIHQARRRRVPVLCVNARMSDRSFRRLRRGGWAARSLFLGLTRVLPCSEQDAERFRALGFPAEKLLTTGNIKLDVAVAPLSDAERARLRAELGLGPELILLGSSTWPGEELALTRVLHAIRAAGVACRLLLVPRHAERRPEIETTLRATPFTYHLRSHGPIAEQVGAPRLVDIAVGDTTGELRKLTQLADLVFVGKSLPPHDQGQTPVEAAALGKAIVFGPGMTNFRAIVNELLAAEAVCRVADETELAQACIRLLRDPAARAKMGQAAQAWHRANQGAVVRTVDAIREALTPPAGRVTEPVHETR
jgi:3-deoxy-D-manno-octulosonic-acid transferase